MKEKLTYKNAGVDIEAGYETVRRIKAHAEATKRSEVLDELGSFGGLFALDVQQYPEPILVSGTDGVGTKLMVAFATGQHKTIGIDAVAYCVNDIICQGAEPLFFLDYIAVGALDPAQVEQVVAGVAEGCQQAGCALLGGETAEMPGFYNPDEYDIAGFAVGVVDRSRVLTGEAVRPGDVLIGIQSTGLQASGFSLVRKVVFDHAGFTVDQYVDVLGCTVGEELMRPTGIYAQPIVQLVRENALHGVANISGGGIFENIPRSLARDTHAVVKRGSWPILPVFAWLQQLGDLDDEVMWNTFNMGLAMVLMTSADKAQHVIDTFAEHGEQAFIIGHVEKGEKGVTLS